MIGFPGGEPVALTMLFNSNCLIPPEIKVKVKLTDAVLSDHCGEETSSVLGSVFSAFDFEVGC